MTPVERLVAAAVTIPFALALGAFSAWTVQGDADRASVRLSWRNAPIRVEECRPLTEEEQAGIPAHMRRSEECTGYTVDYELRLEIEGLPAIVDTVAPSGLRRDRPVYVLLNQAVPAGERTVRVAFTALVPDDFEPEELPARLEWSGVMDLDAGQVGLLTLDETGRTLIRP